MAAAFIDIENTEETLGENSRKKQPNDKTWASKKQDKSLTVARMKILLFVFEPVIDSSENTVKQPVFIQKK